MLAHANGPSRTPVPTIISRKNGIHHEETAGTSLLHRCNSPSCNRPKEPLDIIKNWLSEDCSVRIVSQYMNMGINGYSQELTREYAKDGSFYFIDTRHQWNHTADYDSTNQREYYYRYENNSLVCYLKDAEEEIQRIVLSTEKEADINASRNVLTGAEGLLPSFIQIAFELYGSEYDPETNLSVFCLLEVEKDTLRPVRLTYDYSQIKPYVLSEGALSGEDALDTDLMTLTYEFDFDLPETIPVPDTFKGDVIK